MRWLVRITKRWYQVLPLRWRAFRITGGIVAWDLDGLYEVEINYNHGYIFRIWDKNADRVEDKPVIHFFTNGFSSMDEGIRHQGGKIEIVIPA